MLQELKGTLNSSILIMLLRYFIADVLFFGEQYKTIDMTGQDNVENKQQGHCMRATTQSRPRKKKYKNEVMR